MKQKQTFQIAVSAKYSTGVYYIDLIACQTLLELPNE